MTLIRTDRIWDLSRPIYHDGPAWAEYNPPNLTHNYRRQAEGFNAETLTLCGAWARAVAWELQGQDDPGVAAPPAG